MSQPDLILTIPSELFVRRDPAPAAFIDVWANSRRFHPTICPQVGITVATTPLGACPCFLEVVETVG